MDDGEPDENPRPSATVDEDDDGEFEAVDYRLLTPLVQKKDYTIPTRGEKDFEPDGTNRQERILQASRDAMYAALAVEREVSGKNYIRATWDTRRSLGRLCARDAKGTMFKSMGRTDRHDTTWLMPEELLYLVERGSLECFYDDSINAGEIPMSLQAAYAECIPHVGVDRFQVYSYLKRAGFMVLRASRPSPSPPKPPLSVEHGRCTYDLGHLLSGRLHSLLRRLKHALTTVTHVTTGPLDQGKIYRSYEDVYAKLSFVPCHLHPPHPASPLSISLTPGSSARCRNANTDDDDSWGASDLTISFDVWKPNTNFKKSAPGDPHFRVAVLDARSSDVCSIASLRTLFDTLPETSPTTTTTKTASGGKTFGDMPQMTRLKVGRRNFVLAVVDMGVVSFLSLGDVSFGSESVYAPWKPMAEHNRRGPKKSELPAHKVKH